MRLCKRLTLCKAILFGPIKHEENRTLKDLNLREFLYLTPLTVMAILMGIYPNLFLEKVKPSVSFLARNYQNYRLVELETKDPAFHTADSNSVGN